MVGITDYLSIGFDRSEMESSALIGSSESHVPCDLPLMCETASCTAKYKLLLAALIPFSIVWVLSSCYNK